MVRRLENTGITLEDASRDDIDIACEYVKDIIVSDEELNTIEYVSFKLVAPVPGKEPEYGVIFEAGNGYVAKITYDCIWVQKEWSRTESQSGSTCEKFNVHIPILHKKCYTNCV